MSGAGASSSKLYLTEDLEGRVDEGTLSSVADEPKLYEYDVDEPDEPSTPCCVEVRFLSGVSSPVTGTLDAVSFGPDGWSATVDSVPAAVAVGLALRAASSPASAAVLSVESSQPAILSGSLDISASFAGAVARLVFSADSGRSS